MTLEVAMPGPLPKPASQRRRANKPKSYGSAEPVVAEAAVQAPPLGFDADEGIAALYYSVADSIEGQYVSLPDWHRFRLELRYANMLLTSDRIPGAQAWGAVQSALDTMLISPAEKRRLGIELKAKTVDSDEDAAVAQMSAYRERLGG